MRGRSVENPFESIRLFAMCDAMGFSVLPVAGGLYDQHPDLLEQWAVIFSRKNAHERQEAKEREAKMARSSRKR